MTYALAHLRMVGSEETMEPHMLEELLQEYALRAHLGDSRNSRETYLRQARLFLVWLEERGASLEGVTASTMASWRRDLDVGGYAPATVALKMTAVRKLLLWALEDGRTPLLRTDDLATQKPDGRRTNMAAPKVRQRPVQYLGFRELERLLAAPFRFTKSDGHLRANARRDAAIIALLALRGLREGELVSLTLGAFEPAEQEAALTVTGKGRKQRKLDLDPGLWALVRDYVTETGRDFSHAHRGDWLLYGQRGPMTAQGVIDVVRRHAQRELGRRDVSPHMLRRTFATLASRELRDAHGNVIKPSIPPYVLQRLLGHEDLKTTQRYVNAAAEADGIPTQTYLGVAPPVVPTRDDVQEEEELS